MVDNKAKQQTGISRLWEQRVGLFEWAKGQEGNNRLGSILLLAVSLMVCWLAWRAYQADNLGFDIKSFWDWMELLVVPVVLVVAAWWLRKSLKETEQEIANKNREEDRAIAIDRQHQFNLEAYLDRMTDLLLEEGLRESQKGDEVRSIARSRTLAALRSLDGRRKGLLVQFLHESRLTEAEPAVELNGADLTQAILQGAILQGVNLQRVYLEGADLSKADLGKANLSQADMRSANLTQADLSEADLTGAKLTQADLTGAKLTQADLTGADLTGADMFAANLTQADLTQAELTQAQLTRADLRATKIENNTQMDDKWRLVWSILNDPASARDLSGADLSWASLYTADLRGADLTGANLRSADLRGADLRGAKLDGADVRFVKLDGPDLDGADLRGAAH